MKSAEKQLHPSTQTTNTAGSDAPKAKAPFLLINSARVAEIPRHEIQQRSRTTIMGHDEMQAYIAQCGGVNSRLADFGRVSTHGPQAVAERTLLSIRSAKGALDNLVQAGFLMQPASIKHPSLPPRVTATFEVDPNHIPDLSIAQAFLAKSFGEKRLKRGTLKHLAMHAEGGPNICKSLAVMDAIQVFLCLHLSQDFDRSAGVDPSLIGACCERLAWSAGSLSESRALISSHVQVLSVRVPKEVQVSPVFAKQVMSYLPSTDEMASEDDRFKRALKNLRHCGLVYDAMVLWDSNPTDSSLKLQPSVIATLNVSGPQDKRLEEQLEADLQKFSDALYPYLDVGFIGHSAKVYEPDPGHFRTIVQQHSASTACVVKQLRVRHWAHDANNLGALEVDSARVQREVSTLMKIKNEILKHLGSASRFHT